MPGEAFLHQRPALLQACRNGSFRPAQFAGGLLARLALHVAQHDRQTMLLGEAVDLAVEQGEPFAVARRDPARHVFERFLLGATADAHGLGLQGNAISDAVEPGADALPRHDCGGLADEDEKGGLEGVVGVVHVAEDAAANAEHHRSMAAHDGRKRRFLVPVEVALQQGVIGRGGGLLQHGPSQPLQSAAHMPACHCGPSMTVVSISYLPARGRADVVFDNDRLAARPMAGADVSRQTCNHPAGHVRAAQRACG